MADNATYRKWILLLVAALTIAVVGLFVFSIFGPSTPIAISRTTTYLVEPLDKNGNVDYFEALRRDQKAGVSAEQNAAVLLWQAWGREGLDQETVVPFFRELEAPVPPEQGEYLVDIGDDAFVDDGVNWLRQLQSMTDSSIDDNATDVTESRPEDGPGIPDDLELRDAFDDLTRQAMGRPWRDRDIPPLARWLVKNKKPIDLIFEATNRPRMYSPMLRPTPDDESDEILVLMLLPTVSNHRSAARALAIRSMWHLGNGDVDRAWEDAMACHRLSRLIGESGETLVGQLVAISVNGIARRLDMAILEQDLSPQQIETIRSDLNSLGSCSNMARSLDRAERFCYLDIVAALSRGMELNDLASDSQRTFMGCVDWNVPLEMGNQWYDKMVAAAGKQSYAERKAALDQFDAALEIHLSDSAEPGAVIFAFLSKRERSQRIGSLINGLMLPALTSVMHAEDRANVHIALNHIAVELAAYREKHNTYPEQLDDLERKLLAALPVDLFSEKPFLYRRLDGGYLLYSVGPNLQDDNGSNQMMCLLQGVSLDYDEKDAIDPDADDYAIRLPLPPSNWPQRAPTNARTKPK